MVNKKININLLPSSQFEKSSLGRAIFWFLHFGRYIFVVIELVVIAAFLARFILDKNLSDLNEKIKAQQAVYNSFGSLEKDFLSLQQRLEIIGKLQKEQLAAVQTLNSLASITPSDIYLTNLTLGSKKLSLSAVALSDASIAAFIAGLQRNKQFEEINLSSLSTEGSGKPEIKFSLSTKFKVD